jgi:predicted dithiol-disulfide oxidoreductase (DUF899 family)
MGQGLLRLHDMGGRSGRSVGPEQTRHNVSIGFARPAGQARRGWSIPWFSSFGSDFNYDFHVTLDANVAPVEYNYRPKAEMLAQKAPNGTEGEEHGLSVFFALDGEVFHTYSAYGRGTGCLSDAYALLDMTPYGRQQDFEDSPAGWPQKPTYG